MRSQKGWQVSLQVNKMTYRAIYSETEGIPVLQSIVSVDGYSLKSLYISHTSGVKNAHSTKSLSTLVSLVDG